MRRLLALPLMVVFALPVRAMAANTVIEQAIDDFVKPGYEHLHRSANALSREVDELCDQPSSHRLENARTGFTGAVKAWSEVEVIRFGPITEANRLERLMFWPDRKGIGLRQVQAALATEDATAADPSQLPRKSIAMQGFGAMEYVLYGAGADDLATTAGAYRCRYGAAISANIDVMTSKVSEAWQDPDGFARVWSTPSMDNPNYHTDDEALTELLDTLVQGTEMLRDVRINGFLGPDAAKDKPKQAIFWRSQATLASLSGNFAGMRSILAASGLSEKVPEENRWIVQSIDAQFANASSTVADLSGPIDAILADPKQREKLELARTITSSLSTTIGVRLAGALGLTAGFSSLDGD